MERVLSSTPDPEKGCIKDGAEPTVCQRSGNEASSPESRQTKSLDGLRGLAAFMVYMTHSASWWYGTNGELEHGFGYHGEKYLGQLPFIRSLFSGGNAAVAIFFVLSGYVLSVSPLRMLQKRKQSNCYQSLISATIRRPFRLYIPPLGISFIFMIILQLPFGLSPQLEWPLPKENIISELKNWSSESIEMMHPFRKHGVYEHWYSYDPPAWTLPVEFKGSLLVFLLIGIFSSIPLRYAFFLYIVTGVVLLAIYEWSMACFMGGVVLAINDLESLDYSMLKNVSPRMQCIVYHSMFYVGWFLLGQPGGPRDPEFSSGAWGWSWLTEIVPSVYYNGEYWRFYHSVGAFMLLYGALRIRWLQQFLTTRTLLYLGRVSFSLYLIHIPFEWTIGDRIQRILGVRRQNFATIFDNWLPVPDYGPRGFSTGFLIAQGVILPANLFLAKLATRSLDRFSVQSGRWLVSKLGLEMPK